MLDGLGLAETTPGPLIMVLQFVGFMGAWQHPGSLPPLVQRDNWRARHNLDHIHALFSLDFLGRHPTSSNCAT